LPPRPQLPGVCPVCRDPFPGLTALREHKYKVHGIHWDKTRAVRGTPRQRKEWSGVETRLLRNGIDVSLVELARRLGRSVGAVRTKRKRVLAEEARRSASEATRVTGSLPKKR